MPTDLLTRQHVAASRMREAGADDLALTSLMGHTSRETSRIYMTVTDGGQAEVVAAGDGGLIPRG